LLEHLYATHRSKLTDKWSAYVSTYSRVLGAFVDEAWNILEIGVQNGGSLELWSRYFPKAVSIVGCDIDPECGLLKFDDPRIRVVVGDANAPETLAAITTSCPQFDLIIDDGSHQSADIVKSFAQYFPMLADGGIYLAEDLHCSYWGDFEGGILRPTSSMAFFKRLADILNYEHWGVPSARRELLASFEREFKLTFEEQQLERIHAVEFTNSICIVRKRVAGDNRLGVRVVRGSAAVVQSRLAALDGSHNSTPDQCGNPWSALVPLPEDELHRLRAHCSILEVRNEANEQTQQSERQQWLEQMQRLEEERQLLFHQAQERHAEAITLRNSLTDSESKLAVARSYCTRLSNRAARSASEARDLSAALQSQSHELRLSNQRLQGLKQQLQELRDSRTWRWTKPLRSIARVDQRVARISSRLSAVKGYEGGTGEMLEKCLQALKTDGASGLRRYLKQTEAIAKRPIQTIAPAINDPEDVARQLFRDQQQQLAPAQQKAALGEFKHQPLISVVMPVYKTPIKWLERAIQSLQGQSYENWELCAVDDCSPSDEQRNLLARCASRDPRIRFQVLPVNRGISDASNASLEMAKGAYIALLDHDDELTPDAFFWMVKALNETPDAQFLYSDECKIDATDDRRLFQFVIKPTWSPEIMFNGMITGHLTLYETALVRSLGGFRKPYDFSQDYDLAFRTSRQAKRIVHVERILYLWRSIPGSAANGDKDFARISNIAALNDHLACTGIDGVATPESHANRVRVRVPENTKVSIIIPSDSYDNLRLAIESILECTSYPIYEIVAVCNSPLADRLSREYAAQSNFVFSRYDLRYNFSDKCNQGAHDATGDVLVFYNDDVSPTESDWITSLIEYLFVPGVGGVSPKLLYQDESIQYAGMISGTPGFAGTAFHQVHRSGTDPFLSMHSFVRNVSILSGACCAIKKNIFDQIGGFDAKNTPDGHSDLDLSFKILEAGYRCVYTPYAVLFHIGHGSWVAKKNKYKADMFMLARWGRYLEGDPYFTSSMKKVLYQDFRFKYRIYAAHLNWKQAVLRPDVLLVSHELSLTGAPRMMFYAAKAVLAAGGMPVVAAPADGPLRQELIDAGVAVIIDESVTANHFLFSRFAMNFDTVVVGTMALTNVVRQLSTIVDLKLIWWLHEAQALQAELNQLVGIDMDWVQVVCVSNYALRFVPRELGAIVLDNGIPDEGRLVQGTNPNQRFTFIVPGTIEPRKGQDLLAEAILLLSEAELSICRFVLVGKVGTGQEEFWQAILKKLSGVQEFQYLGLLEHQQTLEQVAGSDMVICASRDEACSLAVMEGAMLGRPSIASQSVGMAEVIGREGSGLLFDSGNAASLAETILYAVRHRDEVREMGVRARKSYERDFTIERFAGAFMSCIEPAW
jgi:GT2 family glycosyltransferase